MQRTKTSVLAASLFAASVALAVPPGHTWGVANCGPAITNSSSGCQLCCRQGFLNGAINATEYAGCRAMCLGATFNAPPNWLIWLARRIA